MGVELVNEAVAAAPTAKRRWWGFSPVLVGSVLLHLVFAGGAATYVVSQYAASRKLTFQAGPKSPNPAERALQHRVQLEKKMQSTTMPAAVPQRVLTTGVAKVTLPPLPDMAGAKTGPDAPKMPGAAAALSTGAASAPMNSGVLGATGSGSQVNFFGIRDVSTSVVIMIDVSNSMFSRTGDAEGSKLVKLGKEQSFQAVRDEAIKLVQSLTSGTRFGIVRWSGGAYAWQPELVPATEDNKQAAIAHIQSEVDFNKAKKKPDRPGGTRHDYALEEAFKLKPETIYMITDGNATGESPNDPSKKIDADDIYRVAEEGQKTLSKKARVHTIYYITGKDKDEERELLMRLASRNGGQFRQVNAPGQRADNDDERSSRSRKR